MTIISNAMHDIQTLIQFMDKNHIEIWNGLQSVHCFVGHTHTHIWEILNLCHTYTYSSYTQIIIWFDKQCAAWDTLEHTGTHKIHSSWFQIVL